MFNDLKIRTKISIGFFVIGLPMLLMGSFFLFKLNQTVEPIKNDVVQSVEEISEQSRLDSLSQFIRYYDEVLTQSARNYAFTRDEKWKIRYSDSAPELDKIIEQAIRLGDEKDKEFFSSVSVANVALVDMELESIGLVDRGQSTEAVAILESNEYWQQKDIYTRGLVDYVARRGLKYDEALTASNDTLNLAINNAQKFINFSFWLILTSIVILIIIIIILSLLISNSNAKPLVYLQNVAKNIAAGKSNQKLILNSKDEIGDLAVSFNKMTENLQQAKLNVEDKILERTAELEKLNKRMVDRELKMIELKKEILELKNRAGKN